MSASTDQRGAYITPDLLERLFLALPPEAVLVGGQSLAIWVDRFGVDLSGSLLSHAISKDADFLGGYDVLQSLHRAINSRISFEDRGAFIRGLRCSGTFMRCRT